MAPTSPVHPVESPPLSIPTATAPSHTLPRKPTTPEGDAGNARAAGRRHPLLHRLRQRGRERKGEGKASSHARSPWTLIPTRRAPHGRPRPPVPPVRDASTWPQLRPLRHPAGRDQPAPRGQPADEAGGASCDLASHCRRAVTPPAKVGRPSANADPNPPGARVKSVPRPPRSSAERGPTAPPATQRGGERSPPASVPMTKTGRWRTWCRAAAQYGGAARAAPSTPRRRDNRHAGAAEAGLPRPRQNTRPAGTKNSQLRGSRRG